MASEPNDLDQYVAYVRAELNKGKYTAFEFMSRERLREILDALTEARAALAVQARTHVVETPVLVQASRRTAYQPQGTPGAPAVTDDAADFREREMVRGYIDGSHAHGSAEPPSGCSAAYRHGWLNGRDDRKQKPRDRASVLRARADMILGDEP